ncbi:MAG: type II toxin-antitoxin system RelE/ParE family toxin [Chlorobi bacterium]|nr:type II toxin-antitoxin system RelE/ParE family toxin [Chlorobiota bacterium]
MKRKIIFYGDFFIDFYSLQEQKIREKIDFVLDLIRSVEIVPIKFLKYLKGTDNLYEIRVSTHKNNLRIFCFFDEGNLIVLINGFSKKSRKTPRKELNMAKKLKEEYFLEKKKRKIK